MLFPWHTSCLNRSVRKGLWGYLEKVSTLRPNSRSSKRDAIQIQKSSTSQISRKCMTILASPIACLSTKMAAKDSFTKPNMLCTAFVTIAGRVRSCLWMTLWWWCAYLMRCGDVLAWRVWSDWFEFEKDRIRDLQRVSDMRIAREGNNEVGEVRVVRIVRIK